VFRSKSYWPGARRGHRLGPAPTRHWSTNWSRWDGNAVAKAHGSHPESRGGRKEGAAVVPAPTGTSNEEGRGLCCYCKPVATRAGDPSKTGGGSGVETRSCAEETDVENRTWPRRRELVLPALREGVCHREGC